MSGNRTGGLKAALKIKAKDKDFYKRIGQIGGRKGTTGGFASTKVGKDGLTGTERAKLYGRKGGLKSRRRKNETTK